MARTSSSSSTTTATATTTPTTQVTQNAKFYVFVLSHFPTFTPYFDEETKI